MITHHAMKTSALGDEWPTSSPGRFSPGTNWTSGWFSPRAGPDAVGGGGILSSRDSSVGIETRLRVGRSGFYGSISSGGWEFFSSPPRLDWLWDPPSLNPTGTGTLSLEVKRPGSEADHSSLSSAEVKECVELYLHSPNTPSWRGAQ
jgi:hypothetical protein